MPYFDEPIGRVKIQTTSKNSQQYYTAERLIRDLLSNTPNYVRAGKFRGYLFTPFFFVTPIQFVACALRENLSNRSSGVQIPRDICIRCGSYWYSTKRSWMIKRGICTFDCSIKVMNNHAGSTFDSACRETVFTYKRSIKLPRGDGCLGWVPEII